MSMSKTFEVYRTTPSDVELERGRFAGEEDSYLDEVPGRREDEDEEGDGDTV